MQDAKFLSVQTFLIRAQVGLCEVGAYQQPACCGRRDFSVWFLGAQRQRWSFMQGNKGTMMYGHRPTMWATFLTSTWHV